MRDKWSDERMDDLNRRIENGFNRVDADLREIRDEIGGLRGETKAEFDSLRARSAACAARPKPSSAACAAK